jgi:hypothetical protein
VVRERLPLVAVVYNDSAYGVEVHHFRWSLMDALLPMAGPGGWRMR